MSRPSTSSAAAPAPPPVLDYPAPHMGPALPLVPHPGPGQTERIAERVALILAGLGPPPPPRRPAPARSGSGRLPQWSGRLSRPLVSASLRLPGARRYPWAYAAGGIVALYLLYVLVHAAAVWVDDRLTTLEYGDIRTTHLNALFGFAGETPDAPTVLTAVNDSGTFHIYVLPAADPTRLFVLSVPLHGDPTGRAVPHLSQADMDRDGHPDLLDTGRATLRPPTDEEAKRIAVLNGGR